MIGTELEIWCYCKECDIETFHPINNDEGVGAQKAMVNKRMIC